MDGTNKNNSKTTNKIKLSSSNELMKDRFKDIEYACSHEEGLYSLAKYSVKLDLLLSGLHRTNVIIVASKPGEGKSAFVHNITTYMAKREVPVLLCSPEMNEEIVSLRLKSILSKVSCNDMSSGMIQTEDWPRLTIAAGILGSAVLNIIDTLPLHITDIVKVATELKASNKLELLIIDSLPFVSTVEDKPEYFTFNIMMKLKRLARNLNIPIILTVPLKAESSDTPQQVPCLDDISSEIIVDVADVIIILNKIIGSDKQKCKVEALVAKNRNGVQGIAPFNFFYQSLHFEDCSAEENSVSERH